MNLQGTITALITPFSNGKVDYGKLKEIVEMQIEDGIDGLLPMGTTGESPTLSPKEHSKVIETVINTTKGRCPVIAGTGANATVEAIELTQRAKDAGADASLQVTPYYNKPSQEGLYRHFSVVADETGIPIVLYNVPGRSGAEIAIDTVARLARHSNIIAIKEAAGSVERVSQILDVCDFTVLSGDDSLTIPMMSVGAKGVISVASNIIPAEIVRLVNSFKAGNIELAMELHKKYYHFFKTIFIETNPVPVKAAMNLKGIIEEEYRLPLCPMLDSNKELLKESMKKIGLL